MTAVKSRGKLAVTECPQSCIDMRIEITPREWACIAQQTFGSRAFVISFSQETHR
jgi:hypothetical protein